MTEEKQSASEETKLVSTSSTKEAASSSSTGKQEQSPEQLHYLHIRGPLTYRILAFIGGLAMIGSNVYQFPRFFARLDFPAAIIALYCFFFGIIVTILELPGQWGRKANKCVRELASILEYTWGRGLFYFFGGTLQFFNWSLLDWIVGGWMIFVGWTALVVGCATRSQLGKLRVALHNEDELRAKWAEFDVNKNGELDVKEFTKFIQSSGVDMSPNEISASFLALDKDFDGGISFDEFKNFWSTEGGHNALKRSISV